MYSPASKSPIISPTMGAISSGRLNICVPISSIAHIPAHIATSNAVRINIFKNKFFNFSFIILLGMILGVYFIPFFASLFGLVTLGSIQWLIVVLTSIAIIPLVEVGKLFIKER